MKRFQSLLASFVLVFVLAAPAAAGIIHTGGPAATPPPPPPSVDESAVRGVVEVGTDEGESTTLDLVVEAALDCLQATFTLF